MRRRVIALVAALALAGVGTMVLVQFVQGAEERAVADEQLVTVFLVGPTPIPLGTPAEEIEPLVIAEQVPIKARAATAITDLSEIAGLAAAVDLVPGEQLIASRFVAPSDVAVDRRDDLPQRRVAVPDGMLEVAVRIDAERALGGIIDVGDEVAIIGTLDYEGAAQGTVEVDGQTVAVPGSLAEGGSGQATHTLLEHALIVEVQADSTPTFQDDANSEAVLTPSTGFVVTFALAPRDVEKLVFLAENGQMWLARQTPDDTGETRIVNNQNVFED